MIGYCGRNEECNDRFREKVKEDYVRNRFGWNTDGLQYEMFINSSKAIKELEKAKIHSYKRQVDIYNDKCRLTNNDS